MEPTIFFARFYGGFYIIFAFLFLISKYLGKLIDKTNDKYFEINIRQLGDMIPKVISNFLINDILDKIYFSMFRKVSNMITLSPKSKASSIENCSFASTLSYLVFQAGCIGLGRDSSKLIPGSSLTPND